MVLARTLLVLASSSVLRSPASACGHLKLTRPPLPRRAPPTVNNDEPPLNSLYDTLQLLHRAGDSLSLEESRERRTSPGPGYRFLSQSLLRRSKMYRNGAKGDRGSRMTLSLDVPTSLMNILFDIAKGKSMAPRLPTTHG